MLIQGNIRRESNIIAVSKQIALDLGRGSRTKDMLRTVITDLSSLTNIKHLKELTQNHVSTYIDNLKTKVEAGDLTRKTTATYVSSLNNLLRYTNNYIEKNHNDLKTISARENSLSVGRSANNIKPTITSDIHKQYKAYLAERYKQTGDIRYKALQNSVSLARELGLRIRETIAIKITNKDISNGNLSLNKQDGTKNSRPRDVAITSQSQKDAINVAKQFSKENRLRDLCPPERLKQQIKFAYNIKDDFEKKYNVKYNYHSERRTFAQTRYNEYIKSGLSDEAARLKLSSDLGHYRVEITNKYL